MGKGDDMYASQLSNAENTNRGRVCGYVGFDPKVEHRMMAGCDFLLMPSQYEPCGLPQMHPGKKSFVGRGRPGRCWSHLRYAQAYGTVPVVHETGGLRRAQQKPIPSPCERKSVARRADWFSQGLKDSVLGLWDEERDRRTATGLGFPEWWAFRRSACRGGRSVFRFLFSGFEENNFKERLYQATPPSPSATKFTASSFCFLRLFPCRCGGSRSVSQEAGLVQADPAEWPEPPAPSWHKRLCKEPRQRKSLREEIKKEGWRKSHGEREERERERERVLAQAASAQGPSQ